MSNSKDSNVRTITVALALCLVCSVLVSAIAVGLKPQQQANQALDRNKNILLAAGIVKDDANSQDVESKFKDFNVKLVNLETGRYATDDELKNAGITDINSYDPEVAGKNPSMSIALAEDPANIKRKPKFAKVYVMPDADGTPKLLVLPIKGYGLWGTIYGFLTLDKDLNTIQGLSFYSHKETPGLGARIEEPQWRALWQGKQSFDEQGEVITGVVKHGSPKPNPNYVDGISGATLTGRGVNNLVQFWLGKDGYKPFIDNLRKGEV